MAAWLPVTASILAVSGFAATLSPGSDCAHCVAPPSASAAAVAPAQAMAQAPENDKMNKHEVYVLKFHADWCPKCKSLNPVFDQASKEFSEKPVGFVKIDVTNATTKKKAEETIKALGLEGVWKQNKGRNGFMLVVDAETKKSVKKLGVGTTSEQASKAIKGALGA